MSEDIFHAKGDRALADDGWISRLKEAALASPRKRARLCLHCSPDDQVQEMLIVLCRDSLVAPHRHLGRSESILIVEGLAHLLLFLEDGRTDSILELGPPGWGGTFLHRFQTPRWHSLLPLTPFLVIIENTAGPFRTEGNETAPWAPKDAPRLESFLKRASASFS